VIIFLIVLSLFLSLEQMDAFFFLFIFYFYQADLLNFRSCQNCRNSFLSLVTLFFVRIFRASCSSFFF